MLTINNNYSASLALQTLSATNRELEEVQGRINTGLKVANAKDNGAVFAIAEGQRARSISLTAVKDGIDRASSSIDVALAAGKAIGEILTALKSKAVAAQSEDLTTEQRGAIQADFDAYRAQIDQIANSASFNGFNLVASGGVNLNVLMSDMATGTTGRQITSTAIPGFVPGLSALVDMIPFVNEDYDPVFNLNGVSIGTVNIDTGTTIQDYVDAVSTQTGGRVTASYNQSNGTFTYVAKEATAGTNDLSITAVSGQFGHPWLGHGNAATAVTSSSSTSTITNLDWTVGGGGALSGLSTGANQLSTASAATSVASAIDGAITNLSTQMATMGSQAKALVVQGDFMVKLKDVVEQGISNLVDADLAKESARLQSLQIKQQLGAQALSIANQSPQLILSFFR